MKTLDLSRCIRLTFACNAEPGTPLLLDKESMDKLAHIPKLLRALANCYGSKLGAPTLWGGCIHLPICSDNDMFDLSKTMISDLATAAQELHENSKRQPPLPLTQAVTHPHCLDLLRALATTYEKSKLTAALDVAGKIVDLPHISLADFTEPDAENDGHRHLRSKVIGVCAPAPDANVVLLGDIAFLELPAAHYPLEVDDVYERVVKHSAIFVGPVELVRKNVYRALPGGRLQVQLSL